MQDASAAVRPAAQILMPLPAAMQLDDGAFKVDGPLGIALSPPARPDGVSRSNDDRVARAAAEFAAFMADRSQQAVQLAPCRAPVRLLLRWRHPGQAVQQLGEDEAYRLDIAAGGVQLQAETPLGILRGLQTLMQWLRVEGDSAYWPAVHIQDRPRFAWRGLMLDAARHFMPPTTMKRNLDAMAAVKMNVLHWHLSDDQSFRVESRRYPELTRAGAADESYTQQDVRDVVAYARTLGIRVVPEFDMPGHTSSWLLGHPELGSAPAPTAPVNAWGILDAALDPTQNATYAFIDGLLHEMGGLFPDAFVHIGGDEVNGVQWRANPRIAAFMRAHDMADTMALQAHFVSRVATIVDALGKVLVGWDEITQPGLPRRAVVQSWRGPDGLRQALTAGHRALLSHGWYLDTSAASHYLVDPTDGLTEGTYDPARLLGGEACQWSELVDAELVDASIWPRTAAVAERLWSPADRRDTVDMYRRLSLQSDRLKALGINHRTALQRRLVDLAQTPDVGPLEQLADVLEGRRKNWWPQFKEKRPLHGFADALYPESSHCRDIDIAVDHVLANPRDPAAAESLTRDLIARGARRQALMGVLEANPKLHDMIPVADDVDTLCRAALEALATLRWGAPMPRATVERGRACVRRAEWRELGLYVALAPPLAKLIEAAAAYTPSTPSTAAPSQHVRDGTAK